MRNSPDEELFDGTAAEERGVEPEVELGVGSPVVRGGGGSVDGSLVDAH